MKRYFAFFCAALLCIAFLTACAQDGDAVPVAPEPPSGTENLSAAQGTLPFPVGTLYAPSWSHSESSLYGCSSGTAYYELEQANVFVDAAGDQWEELLILRTDFATRVQAPLCSVPGCAHTDTGCPAYLRARSDRSTFYLGIVNGQLYVLHTYWREIESPRSAGEKPAAWLEAAAMDGSGRTPLTELPPEWRIPGPFLLTDGTALYGQFVDTSDSSIHGIRIELESGDYTSFSFGLDSGEELVGALGNQFLLSRSNHAIAEIAYPDIISSAERFYLTDQTAFAQLMNEFVLLNPAAGTRSRLSEALLPLAQGPSPYILFYQQQKYYFVTADTSVLTQRLWQCDFAKNECHILAQRVSDPDGGWWTIGSLTLFPSDSGIEEPYLQGSYWDGDTEQGFLLDVHDGAVYPTALRYRQAYYGTSPVVPLAQTDDGLWLVQTAEMPDSWGRYRFSYALAAPETVFSGEGELYPIQMWMPETPLG